MTTRWRATGKNPVHVHFIRESIGGFTMSIHSGRNAHGSRSKKIEITTTLYDLIEAIGESIGSTPELCMSGAYQERVTPFQDRLIATKVAGMFSSGKIKFKRPRDVKRNFPEWFD